MAHHFRHAVGTSPRHFFGGHLDLPNFATPGVPFHRSPRHPQRFRAADLPDEIAIKGRGGTDFRPGFAWLEEHDIRPGVCLYLTDMLCSSYPETEPAFDVVWANYAEPPGDWNREPWGERIDMAGRAAPCTPGKHGNQARDPAPGRAICSSRACGSLTSTPAPSIPDLSRFSARILR